MTTGWSKTLQTSYCASDKDFSNMTFPKGIEQPTVREPPHLSSQTDAEVEDPGCEDPRPLPRVVLACLASTRSCSARCELTAENSFVCTSGEKGVSGNKRSSIASTGTHLEGAKGTETVAVSMKADVSSLAAVT